MIDTKKIVEEAVNEIWKKYPPKITHNVPPLAISRIPNADIVFIGLNPSVKDKEKEALIESGNISLDFYELDYQGGENHSYFNKFSIISEKTNLNWTHLDLLYIRETNQNNVKKLLKTDEGKHFIYDQLMVTKKILEILINEDKSRIFVVNNTLSRDLIGKDRPKDYNKNQEHWLDYRFVWNKDLGTYLLNDKPFFFTSMLTGQRALDNGSFERLIWHINYVKSKLFPVS